MAKVQRNDPCPCGSGKKYKHCCFNTAAPAPSNQPGAPVSKDAHIKALLASALPLHQSGQIEQAKGLYLQILALDDRHFDGLHLLGVAEHQQQNHGKAAELMVKAVAVNAGNPFAFNNLGVAFIELGELEKAQQSLARALALNPNYTEALSNLGNVHKQQGNYHEALEWYQRALDLKADIAEVHNNMAVALHMLRRYDDALRSALTAKELNPSSAEVFNLLGNIYKDLGHLPEAVAHYQHALARNPAMGNAQHFLNLLSGHNVARPPDSYVEKVFDDYAERFDQHLQQVLNYRIPQVLAQKLHQLPLPKDRQWDVLDLGCGTGLAGQEIAGHARHLVGVDLSAKMLAKAARRGIYHRLAQSDLLSLAAAEPDGSYDLVMAADVFVYVGRLDEVFFQISRLLRGGGFFAFSVESCADSALGYQLLANGRYAHARSYLDMLASAHGFEICEITSQSIRLENSQAIPGWLAIWRRCQLQL